MAPTKTGWTKYAPTKFGWTKYGPDQIWVGPNMGPTKYAGPNNKNYIKIKF